MRDRVAAMVLAMQEDEDWRPLLPRFQKMLEDARGEPHVHRLNWSCRACVYEEATAKADALISAVRGDQPA